MMRIIIPVETLPGRLREWNQACAHRHRAGMRHRGGRGGRDRCPWCERPFAVGKEGCCISQLGSNQFKGPFKMSVY